MKKLFTFIFIFTLFFGSINISRAALSVSLQTPDCANGSCVFVANVTPLPTSIIKYDWDFGDGNTNITSSNSISHKYSEAKTYKMKVTITDINGSSATDSLSVYAVGGESATTSGSSGNSSIGFFGSLFGVGSNTSTNTNTNLGNNSSGGASSGPQNAIQQAEKLGTTLGGVRDAPDSISAIFDVFLFIMGWIFRFTIAIGVIMIIVSGLMYILSGGNQESAKKAIKLLIYTIIGIIIAVLSWSILSIIRNLL